MSEEAAPAESEAEIELRSQEKSLVTQYMLVPVSEHPLFPGSSQACSLSEE